MVSFLFTVHVLFGKVAALILEVRTIHGQYFREKACFHLLLKLVDAVAVYESAPSRGMSMQIQKGEKPIIII